MILITGGAGYIGAHIAATLDRKVVVYDNFSHAPYYNIDRIKAMNPKLTVVEGDVTDREHLHYTARRLNIRQIIHCAGLKSIPEGERRKALYTKVNVEGTRNVALVAEDLKMRKVIFSSSAAVYAPSEIDLTEESPLGPVSHYGKTKLQAEEALLSIPKVAAITTILRYFNPVGGDVVLDRGQTNLMPALMRAAGGESFRLFGTDHPTPDGTAIRDYIPVWYLARIHERMLSRAGGTFNVGYGMGLSVLELIKEFQSASGRYIRTDIYQRRNGDVSRLVADASKITKLLSLDKEITPASACARIHSAIMGQWELLRELDGRQE